MTRAWLAAGACAVLIAGAAPAHADKVDDLIALVARKPAGMSAAEWREQRRDAARELGRSGDKRAVEPLMKVAESEKFDAVAEIAIEALGKLGDPRAVPLLKKIADDETRDQYLREAARGALAELGAPAGAEPPPPEEAPVRPARTPTPAPTPAVPQKVCDGRWQTAGRSSLHTLPRQQQSAR
jgi:hypothetical protein